MTNGPSTIDLRVNHGLEINVERDLDPAVDLDEYGGRDRDELFDERAAAVRRTVYDRACRNGWLLPVRPDSVNLYQSTSGRSYAVQTVGWARELTRDLKLIGIRGRFAWGVEATPIFAQFEPSPIYGVGFAPVVWRWNFPPQPPGRRSRSCRWADCGRPSRFPRTPAAPISARIGAAACGWPRGAHAILLAYRFQHFSNGNQLGSNPGVNSHVVLAGWSRSSPAVLTARSFLASTTTTA